MALPITPIVNTTKNISTMLINFLSIIKWIVIVGTCIAIVTFMFRNCSGNKNPFISDKSLKDSIVLLENNKNQLYAQNQSYIYSLSQLKKVNDTLYNETQKLKANTLVISSIKTQIEYKDRIIHDTILVYYDTRNHDKTYIINFKSDTCYDKNNCFNLSGATSITLDSLMKIKSYYTKLNNLELTTKLYLSLTDNAKDKILNINVRSDYPGLKFSELDGYIIDPQKNTLLKSYFAKSHWNIGPVIGVGYSTSNFKPGITFGIGVSYSIFNF